MFPEFFKLIKTSLGTAKRVVLAQVRGVTSDESDDSASDPHDGVEIVQPIGFASRPVITAQTEALCFEHGDTVVAIAIIDKSLSVHTLEEGEAQIYSPKEPTCTIRLRANGKIEITAKSGQDIIFNGGTKAVGRVDDQVQVTIPIGTFLTAASGGVLNATPVTVTGKINAGAPNVKA